MCRWAKPVELHRRHDTTTATTVLRIDIGTSTNPD